MSSILSKYVIKFGVVFDVVTSGGEMKINICVKQVPDPEKFPLGQFTSSGRLIRDSFPKSTNPMDKNASELALNLTDNPDDITVFSMGPESAKEAIRDILAMGAGNGVLVSDPRLEGADLLATASALSHAMKKHGEFDVVLCGVKSTDSEMGILPALLADMLGVPFILGAEKVVIKGKNVFVSVSDDSGVYVWKTNLPCVISVTKNINTPRLPSLRGVNKAMKIDIDQYTVDDLEMDMPENRPKLLEYEVISSQVNTEFIEGSNPDDIANKLITAIKSKGVLK